MAFFAPGGTPGFNQALLKGGTPLRPSRWQAKLVKPTRHTGMIILPANNTFDSFLIIPFSLSFLLVVCFPLS